MKVQQEPPDDEPSDSDLALESLLEAHPEVFRLEPEVPPILNNYPVLEFDEEEDPWAGVGGEELSDGPKGTSNYADAPAPVAFQPINPFTPPGDIGAATLDDRAWLSPRGTPPTPLPPPDVLGRIGRTSG